MSRAVAVVLIAFAPLAAADELPWSLKQRWVGGGGHNGEEWLHSFSEDGKLAFFDQRSGRLIARDTTTWQKTGALVANADKLTPRRGGLSAHSPDGRLRASSWGSKGKRGWYDVYLTRKEEYEPFVTAKAAHRGAPILLFSHDGKTLISASFDALILWDVPGLTKPRELGSINFRVTHLVLSPDGQTLGVTCKDFRSEDQIWDLKTGRMRLALGGAAAWSVAFAPDGKTIATRGSDSLVRLWDAATGFNTRSIVLKVDQPGRPVAFSPDGKQLATAEGPLIRMFDAHTGKATRTLNGHTSAVNALAFSPDGKQLVSGSGRPPQPAIRRKGEPGEVIVWDVVAEKARHVLKAHPLGTSAVAWSSAGGVIATGGYGDQRGEKGEEDLVVLWDATTGRRVRALPTARRRGVAALAFSPDGEWLVHATERGVPAARVVAVGTGNELSCWYGDAKVLAFSPDGSMVAGAGSSWYELSDPAIPWRTGSPKSGSSGRNSIGVFDPRTGAKLASHTIPDGDATTIAWSPDGKSLVTGGADRRIRLWDLVARKK